MVKNWFKNGLDKIRNAHVLLTKALCKNAVTGNFQTSLRALGVRFVITRDSSIGSFQSHFGSINER